MSVTAPNPAGSRRVLTSPYSPDEICRRFRETVGGPLLSDRSVIGYYDRRGFQLHMNTTGRNSFRPVLYGAMKSEGAQTRISCAARLRYFVKVFMAVWFAMVLIIGGQISIISIDRIRNGETLGRNLQVALMAPLMLAFGVGLIYFGRRNAQSDVSELYQFLENTIDATPV